MPAYQQKIAPLFREPPDVFLCKREIKSLEQENAWLKEHLAHQLDRLGTSLPTADLSRLSRLPAKKR